MPNYVRKIIPVLDNRQYTLIELIFFKVRAEHATCSRKRTLSETSSSPEQQIEISGHDMDESRENETDWSSYEELHDTDDESDDGSVTKNNVE